MKIDILISKLAAPAQRAVRTLNLAEIEDLAKFARASIAGLHGIGPSALETIEAEMKGLNIAFKTEEPADEGAAAVETYIKGYPKRTQEKLRELRDILKSVAPQADERISYGVPSLYHRGYLAYYGGYRTRMGLYGSSGLDDDLAMFRTGRGTVRFPLDEPLPAEAIKKMVRARMAENDKKRLANK